MDGSRPTRSIFEPLEVAELETRARAALVERRTIPHARMKHWLQAVARGERPPLPQTEVELEAERDQKPA